MTKKTFFRLIATFKGNIGGKVVYDDKKFYEMNPRAETMTAREMECFSAGFQLGMREAKNLEYDKILYFNIQEAE